MSGYKPPTTFSAPQQSDMNRDSTYTRSQSNQASKEYDEAMRCCLCILAGISLAAISDCISNSNAGKMTASDDEVKKALEAVGVDVAEMAKYYAKSDAAKSIFESMEGFVSTVTEYAKNNNIRLDLSKKYKLE